MNNKQTEFCIHCEWADERKSVLTNEASGYISYKPVCLCAGCKYATPYDSSNTEGVYSDFTWTKECKEHRKDTYEPFLLYYKGYTGEVEYSCEDEVFCGKIANINDLVLFEGKDSNEIKKVFEDAVNDYIELLSQIKQEGNKWVSN